MEETAMTEETHDDGGIGEDTSQGGGSGPLHGQGGEGRAKEKATQPLEEQGKPGQTEVPAPEEDAGGQRGGEDRPE
jgi:hypothetical protein